MKIGTMQAFPNPLMYMSLGEESREMNKELLRDILKEKEDQNLNYNRSGVNVGQTFGNLQTKYESFARFKGVIDSIVDMAAKDFFGIQGKANSKTYWGNIDDNPYGYHMPHSHNAKEIMCGVYFPSSGFTEEDHISASQNLDDEVLLKSTSQPDNGDLVFLDPIHYVKTSVIMKENVDRFPFFGNPICITPREGTLVFFPCWLSHMTTPTAKQGFTRVSIAFGVDFD